MTSKSIYWAPFPKYLKLESAEKASQVVTPLWNYDQLCCFTITFGSFLVTSAQEHLASFFPAIMEHLKVIIQG